MKLIVITGLSGAGRTVTMHALEDLGYFCVDNLPFALLMPLAKEFDQAQAQTEGTGHLDRAAVGIDVRTARHMLEELPETIVKLRDAHVISDVIFLDASDDVLIERYSETRRKHPLSGGQLSLPEAIRKERALLADIKLLANQVIDTSGLNIHQLRDVIWSRVGHRPTGHLSVAFTSFGYKNGLPPDADFVFDLRFLPNPHWDPALRPLTGQDEPVSLYLQSHSVVTDYFESIRDLVERWLPNFEAANRAYLTIALGCTGGRHRSVYMAERLGAHFQAERGSVMIRHREI